MCSKGNLNNKNCIGKNYSGMSSEITSEHDDDSKVLVLMV